MEFSVVAPMSTSVPVFYVRKNHVLLRLIEAMNFVHEQDSALLLHSQTLAGLRRHPAKLGHSRRDGAHALEVAPGDIGNEVGERGLARAGRSPQDYGLEAGPTRYFCEGRSPAR